MLAYWAEGNSIAAQALSHIRTVKAFGCEEKVTLPIPAPKLIDILADVHLAEAAAQSLPVKVKDTTLAKFYNQIYEIHEVSEADFDSSMVLLKSRPKSLKLVYEKVIETIDKRKANIGK